MQPPEDREATHPDELDECPDCRGTGIGWSFNHPCTSCRGTGVRR